MSDERSQRALGARALPPALLVGMLIMALVGGGAGVAAPGAAYLAGYAITMALVAWLVVWFGFLKRTSVMKPVIVYAWLYAATFVGGVSVNIYQDSQFRIARSGLLDAYDQYKNDDVAIDTRSRATGYAGDLESAAKRAIVISASDMRSYEAELNGIAFDRILSEETLGKDGGIVEARFKLNRAIEIVKKYNSLSYQRQDEYRELIDKIDIPDSLRASVSEGAAMGWADNRRAWDIEGEMIREFEKAISVLEKSQGRWWYESGELQFQDQNELDEFNSSVFRVRALAEEQQSLQERAEQRMLSALNGG